MIEIRAKDSDAVLLRIPADALAGASLAGLALPAADLAGADLRGADLRGVDLGKARLAGADLRGAHLEGADLTSADLTDADLTGAHLTDGVFVAATLLRTRMSRADARAPRSSSPRCGIRVCENASFVRADFSHATVVGCDFSGADLPRPRSATRPGGSAAWPTRPSRWPCSTAPAWRSPT